MMKSQKKKQDRKGMAMQVGQSRLPAQKKMNDLPESGPHTSRRRVKRLLLFSFIGLVTLLALVLLLVVLEQTRLRSLGKAQQPYASLVSRSFSGSPPYFTNDPVTVSLIIEPKNGETYYGIEEQLPEGFAVIDQGDANYNHAQHTLRWVHVDYENPDEPLPNPIVKTYTLQAPATPGTYPFSGVFQFEDDPTMFPVREPDEIQILGGLSSDDRTTFLAHYDGSLDADFSVGQAQPSASAGTSFSPGIFRQALVIDANSDLLTYPGLDNLLWDTGAIEFWVKPSWNPVSDTGIHVFFDVLFGIDAAPEPDDGARRVPEPVGPDDQGISPAAALLRIGRWYSPTLGGYIYFNVKDTTGERCYELNSADTTSFLREPRVSQSWQPDTWHHIAVSWMHSPATDAKLYVDGRLVDESTGEACTNGIQDADFRIGNDGGGYVHAGAAIEDLRISNSQRSPSEILDNYEHGLQALGPYCSYSGWIFRQPYNCIDRNAMTLYCDASANIVEKCNLCGGCPQGTTCHSSGTCKRPGKPVPTQAAGQVVYVLESSGQPDVVGLTGVIAILAILATVGIYWHQACRRMD